MNTADIITALDLPASARVDHRVPRKLLLENGAPTSTDKRYITAVPYPALLLSPG